MRALSALKGVERAGVGVRGGELSWIIEGEKIVFKITSSNCLRYLITSELGYT